MRQLNSLVVLGFIATVVILVAPSYLLAVVNQQQILYEADWAGGVINTFAPDGVRSTFATGLFNPTGIAFDTSGNLYAADEHTGALYRYSPSGTRTTVASGLGQPVGVAIDHQGNIFVSDVNANANQIYKITNSGNRSVIASGLLFPSGLAIDASDNLYIADFNRIEKITADGTLSTFGYAGGGARCLAFAPDGSLFLTGDQDSIYRYSTSGVPTYFASVTGRAAALAFDGNGNLFVGDRGQDEIGDGIIYEFTPSGSRSQFASGLNDPQTGLAFYPVPEPSTGLLMMFGAFILNRRLSGRR